MFFAANYKLALLTYSNDNLIESLCYEKLGW